MTTLTAEQLKCLLSIPAPSPSSVDKHALYKTKWATKKALMDGIIQRQPCFACGATAPMRVYSGRKDLMHLHHKSYDDPLAVVWLCPRCHKLLHSKKRTKQ